MFFQGLDTRREFGFQIILGLQPRAQPGRSAWLLGDCFESRYAQGFRETRYSVKKFFTDFFRCVVTNFSSSVDKPGGETKIPDDFSNSICHYRDLFNSKFRSPLAHRSEEHTSELQSLRH